MSSKKANMVQDLIPGDIFHPGEHLKDEIEARELSQQQLADKTGLSKSEISSIVHGRRNITPLTAIKLEYALGIKAEFWMNLQTRFELYSLKRKIRGILSSSKVPASKKAKMKKLVSVV